MRVEEFNKDNIDLISEVGNGYYVGIGVDVGIGNEFLLAPNRSSFVVYPESKTEFKHVICLDDNGVMGFTWYIFHCCGWYGRISGRTTPEEERVSALTLVATGNWTHNRYLHDVRMEGFSDVEFNKEITSAFDDLHAVIMQQYPLQSKRLSEEIKSLKFN